MSEPLDTDDFEDDPAVRRLLDGRAMLHFNAEEWVQKMRRQHYRRLKREVEPCLLAGTVEYDVLQHAAGVRQGTLDVCILDDRPNLYHWRWVRLRVFAHAGPVHDVDHPSDSDEDSDSVESNGDDLYVGKKRHDRVLVIFSLSTAAAKGIVTRHHMPGTWRVGTKICVRDSLESLLRQLQGDNSFWPVRRILVTPAE